LGIKKKLKVGKLKLGNWKMRYQNQKIQMWLGQYLLAGLVVSVGFFGSGVKEYSKV